MNTVLKIQIENLKIELCIAVNTIFLGTFIFNYTCIKYGTSFWPYLVTIDELGNKTDVNILLVSSVMSALTFTVIETKILLRKLVLKSSWCFGVSADISSSSIRLFIGHDFFIALFAPHALMCQGQCFQNSSPNSL